MKLMNQKRNKALNFRAKRGNKTKQLSQNVKVIQIFDFQTQFKLVKKRKRHQTPIILR